MRSTITNSSVGAGVTDQHLEHKAVHLGFGQRIGAFGFDRVLRRQHQEWVGHAEGLAADGHLALLHHFQQGALHLGRGAVDLIGQQQVGEDRAERGVELAGFLVVDPRAHQVGGHQVGGELDALELAADGLGQGFDRHGFGQAGHAFDQDMAARQQGDDQALQQVILPDDDLLHFIEDPFHRLALRSAGVHQASMSTLLLL